MSVITQILLILKKNPFKKTLILHGNTETNFAITVCMGPIPPETLHY